MIHSKILAEIHRIMKERQLSRSELARRMDCSPANVTKLLDPDGNPTIESMRKLVAALGIEKVELVFVSAASTTKPRSRRGPKPGPRNDYTPHLLHMEEALASGASRRQAAKQASDWAKEAGHAAVCWETLRRHHRTQHTTLTASSASTLVSTSDSAPPEIQGLRSSDTMTDMFDSIILTAANASASFQLRMGETLERYSRLVDETTRTALTLSSQLAISLERLDSEITACLKM